jgi:hypothetical protein
VRWRVETFRERLVVDEAVVEHACDDDEEGEEEELCEEAGDDELFACMKRFECTHGLDAATYSVYISNYTLYSVVIHLDLPAPWSMKLNTSPATNIFVSHFRRTSAYLSPSTRRMIRPSMMYIDAAKSAGATRIRRDCMMNGPRAQISLCDRTRPRKPTISTERGQHLSYSMTRWNV